MNQETQALIDELHKWLSDEEEIMVRQVQLHFDRTRRILFEKTKEIERAA